MIKGFQVYEMRSARYPEDRIVNNIKYRKLISCPYCVPKDYGVEIETKKGIFTCKTWKYFDSKKEALLAYPNLKEIEAKQIDFPKTKNIYKRKYVDVCN